MQWSNNFLVTRDLPLQGGWPMGQLRRVLVQPDLEGVRWNGQAWWLLAGADARWEPAELTHGWLALGWAGLAWRLPNSRRPAVLVSEAQVGAASWRRLRVCLRMLAARASQA